MKKHLFHILTVILLASFALGTGCSTKTIKSNISSEKTAAVATNNMTNPELLSDTDHTEIIADINMVSVDSGYAITKDFHVLKTSDGGSNWTEILTISDFVADSEEPSLFVLNDKTVYVAFYTVSGIEIEKSVDSGENWSKSSIEMQVNASNKGYGGSLYVCFINKSDGFLLACGLPAGGMMSKTLYKTSDGGSNWILVCKNLDLLTGNSLAIEGYPTGMTFLNKNTGYITCTYHGQNEISVYKTVDSGDSWSATTLSVPTEYVSYTYGNGYYVNAYAPTFLGKNAIIELYFCHNDERYAYIYNSDDMGATWKIEGISNNLMVRYCFIDIKNGFGLDENGILYLTKDGGIICSMV
jgi:photosystem II stability/assembly factor-like uncharacterized protein